MPQINTAIKKNAVYETTIYVFIVTYFCPMNKIIKLWSIEKYILNINSIHVNIE